MENQLTEEEIRALEAQLSCPQGDLGIEVGNKLHESNLGMTLNTVELLDLESGDVVLELGHGNCRHLEQLLSRADDIQYYGLEISETMWSQAKLINAALPAQFELYDGKKIPYADQFFDKMMSVNTIYFWSDPVQLIKEIERTLKPGGICIITYGDKDFMSQLPVVGDKFKLYGLAEINDLIKHTILSILDSVDASDYFVGPDGSQIERKYSMTTLMRQ